MSLSGRLEDVVATDLFQFVQLGHRSGTLTLHSGEAAAEIGFHRGAIVNARMAGKPRLGELLVARGALAPEELERAVQVQSAATPRPLIGQVLLAGGHVAADAVYAAVREQVGAVMREVVGWKAGRFDFQLEPAKPAAPAAVPDVHLDTQAAVLEALRQLDEKENEEHPAGASVRSLRE